MLEELFTRIGPKIFDTIDPAPKKLCNFTNIALTKELDSGK